MNKTSICLFGGALLGAGLSSSAIAGPTAAITVDGSLMSVTTPAYGADYGSYAYSLGDVTIDTVTINVLTDGDVQFDMLSYGIFDSYIDSVLFLFGGNTLSHAGYIDGNDDISGGVVDFNGSVDGVDSFLDVFLPAGEYTIAIASFGASLDDVVDFGYSFGVLLNTGGNGLPTEGQYRLDIFGDVETIPAPAVTTLLGFAGCAGVSRRRRSRTVAPSIKNSAQREA